MKVNRHRRRISATLLLGVFLFTLLHNVVPHFHHTHGDDEIHFEEDHADHHSHSHGHSHDQDSNQEKKIDLLHLFGIHSHNFHVHNPISISFFKFEKDRKTTKSAGHTTAVGLKTCTELLSPKVSAPQEVRHYASHNPMSIPLRGPPNLG